MSSFSWPPKGGSSGSGTAGERTGKISLASGVASVSLTYATPLADNNYSLCYSMVNTIDASPIFLIMITTVKSGTGFTVTFNAPTDTANYVFEYSASGDQV